MLSKCTNAGFSNPQMYRKQYLDIAPDVLLDTSDIDETMKSFAKSLIQEQDIRLFQALPQRVLTKKS